MRTPELLVTVLVAASGCAAPSPASDAPSVRWLRPTEMKPTGSAPGAHHRLLATRDDGSKDYVLILATGDDVATALSDFARAEKITAARMTAIGAVEGPEVAWFDPAKKQYKAMQFAGQVEVLSLVGDVGVNSEGLPVVHAHLVLGRSDGSAIGGHLVHAIVSPTLEVFVTTYSHEIVKKHDDATDLLLFDLTAPAK